eukprot:Gb_23251 [translate_table: standard]
MFMRSASQTEDFHVFEPSNLQEDPYDYLKDQISPLKVHLIAVSLPPRLKTSVDHTLKFHCFGSQTVSHSCYLRELFLENEYNYNLPFCVRVSSPFSIVEASCVMGSEVLLPSLADFVLLPKSTLKLTVKFRPDEGILSRCQDMTFDSELVIHFRQICEQVGYISTN